MKTVSQEYSFSKPELQILIEIAKGKHELSSIEEVLLIKPSLLSYNLKKLQNKGLIKTTQKKSKKQAYFSDSKPAALLRGLLSFYDYIDWENILCGKATEILFQTTTKSGKNLASIPKNTLWRHLKNLKARGIITQQNTINPKFDLLIQFIDEYQQFFINKIARTISDNSVILWQQDMDFIVRVPKNAKPSSENFHSTATSVFHQYDLPLFSEYDIYLYSINKKAIKPEDAIMHTLLIEPNNVRYTTYALLLLKKTEQQIDKTYLLQEAERLGLKTQIIGMLQFLQTHMQQQNQSLPSWSEFVSKAKDYKVITQ
jgi:DNA-binding HxlR family transcriptional regulator